MNNVYKRKYKGIIFQYIRVFYHVCRMVQYGPFKTTLVKAFDMTKQELAVLLIANLCFNDSGTRHYRNARRQIRIKEKFYSSFW